ncbi:MAG: hypothetical protein AAFX50_23820 [Acidobacteriota bacterium]
MEKLLDEGFEFVVIGGCAVSAYAALLEETSHTADLDILMSESTLERLLRTAADVRARVVKRPSPRNVPVALFDVEGLEVNVLTHSNGLPNPEHAVRLARIFSLQHYASLEVPIADPLDLLANKMALRRDKDRPHIAILKRFIETEILELFASETNARRRLGPANRYLEVLGTQELPEHLGSSLIERAKHEVDFRFLAHRLPLTFALELRRALQSSGSAELAKQVERILESRTPA